MRDEESRFAAYDVIFVLYPVRFIFMKGLTRIKDPGQIQQITTKLFLSKPVRLLGKQGEFEVEILKYENDLLEIRHDQPASPVRHLKLQHHTGLMILECEVVEAVANQGERVRPVILHLHRPARKEQRVPMPPDLESFVSGCVPLDEFTDKLNSLNPARDKLVKLYEDGLAAAMKKSSRGEVSFLRTTRLDFRMRQMEKLKKSIFVPDRTNPDAWGLVDGYEFLTRHEYEMFYNRDIGDKTMISEAAEPLMYRGVFMYGYIMAQGQAPYGPEDMESVRKVARKLEADLEKSGCLPVNPARCSIADVSRSGIGLVHPASPAIRTFVPGEPIIFDLTIAGQDRMPFIGIVRNLKPQADSYRVGLGLENLSPEQSDVIEQYLDNLNN